MFEAGSEGDLHPGQRVLQFILTNTVVDPVALQVQLLEVLGEAEDGSKRLHAFFCYFVRRQVQGLHLG